MAYICMCMCIYTHTHTHKGILLSHKKEWANAICSNMDGPRDCHTNQNKSELVRQKPYDTIFLWNLKCATNKLIYKIEADSLTNIENKWTYLQNRLPDIENKHMVTKGERGGKGIN